MAEKASIRYNNPGAMWGHGNKIAAKWGAKETVGLNDGLGQGNNIAVFPTKLAGACAQFDLWRTGYCNMTLEAAIRKWSGGNWSQPYANFLTSKTGLGMGMMVTTVMLSGPTGVQLMKYQAEWEAGKPYPLSDAEWRQAQVQVFAGTVTKNTKKVIAVSGAVTTASVAVSQSNGSPIVLGALAAVVVAFAVWFFFIHQRG